MNDLISSLNSLNSNNGTEQPNQKDAVGLPSPKGAMPSSSSMVNAGLPSPKGAMPTVNAGLPSPKGAMPTVNSGLPSPKGAMPTVNAGLPSPKGAMPTVNAGLPSPKGAMPMVNGGLPSPKGAMPMENAGFPSPKDGIEMDPHHVPSQRPLINGSCPPEVPHSMYDQRLPQGTQRKNTVALSSIDFDRTSYSSQEIRPVSIHPSGTEQVKVNDPLGLMNPEDSALNIPKLKMGNALSEPYLKTGYQEPAAFNPVHDINEDSGLPLMDDPLSLMGTGEPLFSAAASGGDNKLSKGETRSSAIPKDKMDLFGALGNAIKMPDDITPIPQAMNASESIAAMMKPSDDSTPIPQSMRGSMASLMHPASGSMAQSAGSIQEVGGDVVEASEEDGDELVFELDSIKSDEKTAAKSLAAAKTETEKKVELKFWQKKRFIIGIVAFVLVGLLAFAVFNAVYQAKTVEDDELAYIPEKGEITLNWDSIKLDGLTYYKRFYDNSIDKIANMESGPERLAIQGQILTAVVLGMVRFPDEFKADFEMLDASASTLSETCISDWCAFGLWAWGELRQNESLSAKFIRKIPQTEQMDELKPIVKAAALYANWTPDTQTFEEYEKSAQAILAAFPEQQSFANWPVGAWIKATALARLGRHQEALNLIAPLVADEKIAYSGILELETELSLAMSKSEQALKVAERLLAITALTPKEKFNALTLKLVAESSVDEWNVFQKKLIEFNKTYGKNPMSSEAIARACFYTNLAEKCRLVVRTMTEFTPKDMNLRNAYLRILMAGFGFKNINRPDMHLNKNAIEQMNSVVEEGMKLDPQNSELWKYMVLASFAARDFEKATAAMDEIERGKEMDWFGVYLRQIIPYATATDEEKADIREALKTAAKTVHKAEESVVLAHALDYVDEGIVALDVLNRAAMLHPDETIVLDERFDLAVSLGNKDVAEQSVRLLEARNAMMTHHEFDYAKLIEMRGDSDAALEHMLTLIGKDPENPVYLSYIGELFYKQNQCDSAMPYFEQSLENNPNNALARYYRGRCRFEAKQYEAAMNEFNEAATQEETNLLYILWIGRSLAGLNQLLEAQRSFTTVIDAFTAQNNAAQQQVHDPANLPEAYFRRAEIRKLQNYRTEARSDYMKALELSPENVEYLTGYSIYLYENEILDECIDYVTQTENIVGDNADPRLLFVRGLSNLKLNRRNDAIFDLERALKLGFGELEESNIIGIREPAEIYERLGYLYRDIGKRDSARKALTMFLEKSKTLSERTRKEIQGEIDKI